MAVSIVSVVIASSEVIFLSCLPFVNTKTSSKYNSRTVPIPLALIVVADT